MSLFSTLQISNNALIAAQLGLQVVGNNIANANTPGYVRQDLLLQPAPTQRYGKLLVGTGVEVAGIIQRSDALLQERLRSATSDLASSEAQQDVYSQLETLMGELGDSDLSSSLTSFFGSLNDILNQPESVSVRNLAVLQGQTLATDINQLDSRVRTLRSDANTRVVAIAEDINSLTQQIARLNVQILTAEGGNPSASDAVGLRDQREVALNSLAKLIDVKAVEQPSGDVTLFVGGDYLVSQGTARKVIVDYTTDRGLSIAAIKLAETDSPLQSTAGELGGLVAARDEILGGFLDRLDDLTKSLISGFNLIHASGQGLTAYSSLTSNRVSDTSVALDHAGLAFIPTNGSFQVIVTNKQTGLSKTHTIQVDLNGLDQETSLADLVSALDGIDGLRASLTSERQLQLTTDSSPVEFSFANDTSGALAALGLNTFFTGSSAMDIAVNNIVRQDPSKLAASSSGVGEDTRIAELLANFFDTPLNGGNSLAVQYDKFVADTVQGSALTKSASDGFRTFQQTLEGQSLAITSVSLDEEAVKMITYQRMFQANAKLIAAIDEMLQILVNL